MAANSLTVRVVVEHSSMALVYRVSEAMEEAEMASTRALLIERLGGGLAVDTVIGKASLRVALRPFAELLLREVLQIAEQPGLLTSTREQLAQQAMADAGYA